MTDEPSGVGPGSSLNPGDDAPTGTKGTGEDTCPDCGGSGELRGAECPTCRGTGKVVEGIGGG